MKTKTLNGKGFSLVELLIAMALASVVLGAIYSLYTHFLRTSTGQDKLIEIQQEGRAAMERMSKEMRAAGCYYRNTPIITATSGNFEFESDTDPDPARGPWMIKYELDSANRELLRSEAAWTGMAYGAYSAGQQVAGHVTGLTFSYYDENGAVIPAPITSQANRDTIRRVDISLVTQTDTVNPSTNKIDSITLATSLHMRCMGVQQSTDTAPCALPTNIQSSDSGICGRLNLTWTKSSSSDAAGYKIYFRPTGTSFYSGLVEVKGGSTEAYTLTGLQNGIQYDIAMKCYDTSGNTNGTYQGPVTGTAAPIDAKPDDSAAPELPTGTDAAAGDGTVSLSWTASTSVDTGGYNIYRSDDSGLTYAKVAEVDSTRVSYADLTVTNCPVQPYLYKVTSWDCAANENPHSMQTATFGDAAMAGGITDQPVNGTTSTNPTETTPPGDPVNFMALAGADKVYLSYATPADADLKGTRILRRADQFPTDTNDAGAIGPNNVKDYEPLIPSQTYTLEDSYSIAIGTTYYYRAFAYDGCQNYGAGTISQATAMPCGDGAVGSEHFGPPSAPSGVTPAVCSAAALSWPASAGSENGNLFNPASENDVVGYNVYRSTGGVYTKLNATPVTSTSYSDSTVATGNTYYYYVTAVDCAAKESTVPSATVTVIPSGIDWDTGVKALTYGSTGIAGSQHNVVKLGIKNLGNTAVTINSATMTWTTATALVKKVTLKPFGGSVNTLWDDTVLPLTSSGAPIDFTGFQPDATLRRLAAGSTLNELTIEFRDSSNGAFVDLRGATINVTIGYTNDSAGSSCTSSTFSVPVPVGPVISSTTQNRPVEPTTSNLNPGTVVGAAGAQDASYVWTLYATTVDAAITPESGTTLSSQKLYYATTSRSVTTPPSSDYSASPAGWTAVDMCQVGASNIYETTSSGLCTSTPIPNQSGKRVWYYIKTVDSNGNYDIQPEPSVGVYTYDQDARFDVTLWSGRDDDPTYPPEFEPNRAYLYEWIYVTDQDYNIITGATATITVASQDGTPTNTAVMTDCSTNYCAGLSTYYPGWYYYAPTSSYNDKVVVVDVTVKKSMFTDAKCGDPAVMKDNTHTTWEVVTCSYP